MRHCLEKERLLRLTLAVYGVTAVFPVGEEGDDLGSKIRKLADKVLAGLLLDNKYSEDFLQYIEEILALFGLAEEKKLADARNFLVLRQEYVKIKTIIAELDLSSDSHRQEKILAVINSNGAVKIGDFVKLFPRVNRRTILRDLDKLCQTGAMVRNGIGRGVYYAKNGRSMFNVKR